MEPLTITLVIDSYTMMYLTSISIASFLFTLSIIMFYRRFCIAKRKYRKVDKQVIEDAHETLKGLKTRTAERRSCKFDEKKIDDVPDIDVEVHEDIEKYLDEDTLKMVNKCKNMMPSGKFDQVKSVVLSYVSGKGEAKSLGEALHNELNIGFFLQTYIDNNGSVSQIEDLRNENRRNMAVSKIKERQKVREINNVDVLKRTKSLRSNAVDSNEINDIKLELARLKKTISKGKGKLESEDESEDNKTEDKSEDEIIDNADESEDESDDESDHEIIDNEDREIVDDEVIDNDEELDYIEGEHESDSGEDLELDIHIPEFLLEDD